MLSPLEFVGPGSMIKTDNAYRVSVLPPAFLQPSGITSSLKASPHVPCNPQYEDASPTCPAYSLRCLSDLPCHTHPWHVCEISAFVPLRCLTTAGSAAMTASPCTPCGCHSHGSPMFTSAAGAAVLAAVTAACVLPQRGGAMGMAPARKRVAESLAHAAA
jgi:hypothetical protein